VRGRTKHVLPPPHKTKLYKKVDLLLQSTQLIGMNLSIEHIILVVCIAAIKWPCDIYLCLKLFIQMHVHV
jgi:hypothetical protein